MTGSIILTVIYLVVCYLAYIAEYKWSALFTKLVRATAIAAAICWLLTPLERVIPFNLHIVVVILAHILGSLVCIALFMGKPVWHSISILPGRLRLVAAVLIIILLSNLLFTISVLWSGPDI